MRRRNPRVASVPGDGCDHEAGAAAGQRGENDVGVSDEGGDAAIFLKHLSLGKNLRVELRANLFGQA